MLKVCVNDQVEFEAKRETALFCSAKCRVAFKRKGGEIELEAKAKPAKKEKVIIPEMSDEERADHQARADKLGITLEEFERRLQAFIKMGVAEVTWIPTGIPDFDELTMIPRGRITQIQGRWGAGKTTLCLNMIKGLTDRKVLYIDTESALTPLILASLGVDDARFTLYNDSSYIEDIAEIIRNAAKSGDYELIVLDSVPMTSTKTIAEGNVTDANIGRKAKILHTLMEWIAMDLKKTNTAMVFINQVRDVVGGFYPDTYTPGGTAIPFQASLIVQLRSAKSWRFPKMKQGAKGHVFEGQKVEATIVKSKVNNPGRVKEFNLYYPNPHPATDEGADLNGQPAF